MRDFQEKDIILKAGICGEKNIHVIGTMRYDRIFHIETANKTKAPRQQVTLFSPFLILPGMRAENPNLKYTTLNPDEGIFDYFH